MDYNVTSIGGHEEEALCQFDHMRENPKIARSFGELLDGDMISIEALALLHGKHPKSIQRAIKRGELPCPVKLYGSKIWMVKTIRDFTADRLRQAEERSRSERDRLNKEFGN